jgi:hypothetical protein
MKTIQKGFLIPLIVFIVAALAIGGGVFYFKAKRAEAPGTIDTNATTSPATTSINATLPVDISGVKPVTTPQNSPAVDTSAWKTYSDPKFPFKFKYPPTWQIRAQVPRDGMTGVQVFTPESYAKVQAGETTGKLDYVVFRQWTGTTAEIDGLPGMPVRYGDKVALDTGWNTTSDDSTPIRFVRFSVEPPVTVGATRSTVDEKTMDAIIYSIVFTK